LHDLLIKLQLYLPKIMCFVLKIIITYVVLIFMGSYSYAEDKSYLQKEAHILSQGEELKLIFPAAPQGRQIRLGWEARMDSPKEGGSNFHLEIELNGRQVGAMLTRRKPRLINKPVKADRKSRSLYWYADEAGWRIPYSPNFNMARKLVGYSDDDYGSEVNVTDLCRNDGNNELIFRQREVKGPKNLILRNVYLSYYQLPSSEDQKLEANLVPNLENSQIKSLMSSNELGIQMGSVKLLVSSRYSLPGGGWAALKGVYEKSGHGGILKHADFHVKRTVRSENDRLVVEEIVQNLRKDRPIGIRIEHRIEFGDLILEDVSLGGRPDPSLTSFHSPSNPTVFAKLGGPGIGVVLEDDAMRAQHELIFEIDPDRIGWQTHQFALAQSKTYRFQYSIYPIGKGDYFTFINKVRQHWGSPRHMDGPYALMFDPDKILNMKADLLKEEIERLGIKGFGSRAWHMSYPSGKEKRLVAFGTGVMIPEFEKYRSALRNAATLIHGLSPGTKLFVYANMHRQAPMNNDILRKFREELVMRHNGTPFSEKIAETNPTYGMVPSTTGPFGQKFIETVEAMIRDLGFDGIYLDESKCPGGNTWTYNRFDGLSGNLDSKSNEVKATKASIFLLGLPYRLQLYEWLSKRNLFILANGSPPTMVESRMNFLRMVETHRRAFRAYETHLNTPLAYTMANPPMNVIREKLMMGTIPFRVAPGAKHNVLKYFFPLTITELGKGYIISEERIITAVPGLFALPSRFKKGLLYLFDMTGVFSRAPEIVDLKQPFQIEVPNNGIAVLIGESVS